MRKLIHVGKDPLSAHAIKEEQAFWSSHDSTEYIDYSKAELGFSPELKPSSKTISIRLPESVLEAVKVLANKKDVPYQPMMKVLLAEKVREELELETGERKIDRRGRKKGRLTEKDVERIVFEDR